MNIIREVINAGKSGGHIGKGNKYYSQGDYKNALHQYELAAQYYEQSSTGPNPALLEYLATTHAQLGNLNEALAVAEGALSIWVTLNLGTDKEFAGAAKARLEYLIELLRNNDKENLKKYLHAKDPTEQRNQPDTD